MEKEGNDVDEVLNVMCEWERRKEKVGLRCGVRCSE
jgi:hypothetical protein